jgi:hypothetical protein
MVQAFDERDIIGVPTAFQAFFGRPETGGKTLFSPNSSVVDIDILRGNEKIAPLIRRGVVSTNSSGMSTQEGKSTNQSRIYPLIEEEGSISASELNDRVAGEAVSGSGVTKEGRLRLKALAIHKEHVRRIARTFEVLCAQSILTGKMDAIIGTSETALQYDFRRLATHIITVGTAWDAATPDIMGDFDTACGLIRQDGHVTADMTIIGEGAFSAFLNDTTTKALADNRRIEMIQVSKNHPVPDKFARFIAGGITPRGSLTTPGGRTLWMFTYDDLYVDLSDASTLYMPTGSALVCASGARCDRYFGPSELLPMDTVRSTWYQSLFGFSPAIPPMPPNIKGMDHAINPAMFYHDAYHGGNQKGVTVRSQAAPIFSTTMTDAFVTLNGLLT